MPTYGSLTKAGKVRSQTHKIEGKDSKSPIPRIKNWENYLRRIVNMPSYSRR